MQRIGTESMGEGNNNNNRSRIIEKIDLEKMESHNKNNRQIIVQKAKF